MAEKLTRVDHSALRTNQGAIIVLLAAGFIADAPVVVLAVGFVMLLGTAIGKPGFVLVYRFGRRLGLIKPYLLNDNAEPHRFAQGFGGAVLMLAGIAFWIGWSSLAWGLTWLVIALAALNLFAGFCLGCAFYYWFNRLGIPGFSKSPPPNTIPGRRPPSAI